MNSLGNRGDMRGKPYDNKHGRPLPMLYSTASGGYKEMKFHRVGRGVGVAHSTANISKTT